MEMRDQDKDTQTPTAVQTAICVGALCILGALMYYSITYDYPSGKPPGLASFVMLWLREIAILLFAVAALAVFVAVSAVQRGRRVGKTDNDGSSTKEASCRPQQTDSTENVGRDG